MTTKQLTEFTLSNGVKVEIDTAQSNGELLMKCRDLSGGAATVIYLLCEIATFDGKKIPAPELLSEWSDLSIIELEQIYTKYKRTKK